MTVYTALNAVRNLIDPLIEDAERHIGTHSPSCYKYHAACLAVLIRDEMEAEMKAWMKA